LLGAIRISRLLLGRLSWVDGTVGFERRGWERIAPMINRTADQKGRGRATGMVVAGGALDRAYGLLHGVICRSVSGLGNSVFRRFSRWSVKGVWWRGFRGDVDDPDFDFFV